MSEIHCKIFGRVQGVFYRSFVKDVANRLGLFGSVENLDDGSVEVIVQGNDDILKDFLDEIKGGSPLSRVDSVDVHWGGKEIEFDLDEFLILY